MNTSILTALLLCPLTASLSAQTTIQVDFGISTQSTPALGWNNAGAATAGGGLPAPIADLADQTGALSGIGMTTTKSGTAGTSGSGANYGGPYPAAIASLPTTALQDGLFFAQGGGTITLALTGLNAGSSYDFILYGARGNNGSVETVFTVTGVNTGSGSITGVLNNATEVVEITGISPTATGELTVVCTTIGGASSNGGSLNLMVMNEAVSTDTDLDGMPDQYEDDNGLNKNFPGDANQGANDGLFDNDGLTNLQEYDGTGIAGFHGGTDPQDDDSDNDGLKDGEEVFGTLNPWSNGVFGTPPGDATNPLDDDSDGDTVKDGDEITNGTDPNAPPPNSGPIFPFVDTDGDSYRDAAETAFGSSPTDPDDCPDHTPNPARPNVVIIYADDMGLGDMSAYGDLFGTPSPAITPHMNALADEGVLFTQAHSSNGVCTPSRYALLTGKYNWRLFDSITQYYGYDSGPGRSEVPLHSDTTIAEFLKTHGYETAAFGKWHLGGYWHVRNSTARVTNNPTNPATVDWARPVDDHAVAHGFDTFQGLGVTINIGPYVYMQDDRVQYWDTSLNGGSGGFRDATNSDTFHWFTTSELNSSVVGAKDSRASLGDPSYRQVEAGPIMISQVEDYIAERATTGDPDPFFAYVSLYSPHQPWALTPPFIGSDSASGFHYADWMREVDDRIGRVIDAIDNHGFHDNTIVILTSDNGTENAAMSQSIGRGKDPNGPLRGNKRDVWDGGTRVPFVVRWPGQAAAGLKVADPIWQGDIFATVAAYLGAELPDDVAPDGESFLNLIRGQNKPSPHRDSIVLSSMHSHLGLKTLDGWKFIDATGGGGDNSSWDSSNNAIPSPKGTNQGVPKQLFHQAVDLGEDDNLIAALTNDTAIRAELVSLTGTDLLGSLDQYRTTTTSVLFPRVADNDADSMPNSYELAHGLDPNSPKDADNDLDGDGSSNHDEFVAGTDPGDPNDYFRITDLHDSPDEFSVTWPSNNDRSYTVTWSTGLQSWTIDSTHAGTGASLSATLDKSAIDDIDGIPGNLTALFVRVSVTSIP